MNEQNEKRKIVFGIYPNACGFGFVYMDGPRKIIDYGVVRINPISNAKILARIKQSLAYLRPTVVVVQDPDGKFSRTGSRVSRLIEKIEEYAQGERLQVFRYSRDQIREVFLQFGATTKYEIAQVLLTEFKELENRGPKKRTLWAAEDRNLAIFDALSLAITWHYLNE